MAKTVWSKGVIPKLFHEGKIIRARYGIREAETGYREYLGVCEPDDNPWARGGSRDEFMARKGLQLTLIHALDVSGFRSFLGLPRRYQTDEELMETMHEERAKSCFIPKVAREESLRWLQDHKAGPKDNQQKLEEKKQ